MANKKILLVEDDYNEIIRIQESLSNLEGQHSLHVAHKIADALQVLMGGSSQYGMENYVKTGKVRPDIVLLKISFLQVSAQEFLEVINKYYSLKNIRVFIYGSTSETLDPVLAQRYNIAGYLTTPFNLSDTINESILRFRRELIAPGKALFSFSVLALNKKLIGLINYFKAKTAAVYFGQTVATKIAVSAAATMLVAGAVSTSLGEERTGPSPLPLHKNFSTNVTQTVPDACTEQEALVAAECLVLPEYKPMIPQNEALHEVVKVRPKVIEQAVAATDRAPAREFRIVAIEETE